MFIKYRTLILDLAWMHVRTCSYSEELRCIVVNQIKQNFIYKALFHTDVAQSALNMFRFTNQKQKTDIYTQKKDKIHPPPLTHTA